MAKESILTPAEKSSVTIDHFIFHILIAGKDKRITLSEIGLTDD